MPVDSSDSADQCKQQESSGDTKRRGEALTPAFSIHVNVVTADIIELHAFKPNILSRLEEAERIG